MKKLTYVKTVAPRNGTTINAHVLETPEPMYMFAKFQHLLNALLQHDTKNSKWFRSYRTRDQSNAM